MHIVIPSKDMTPKQLKQWYESMAIVVPDEANSSGNQIVFAMIEGIKLDSYLIARWYLDTKKKKGGTLTAAEQTKLDNFNREHIAWMRKLLRWRRKNFGLTADAIIGLKKCFQGKGRPEDYELALELAVLAGYCEPTKLSVQRFCNKRMGIDCSGFVSAYYQLIGKLPGREAENARGWYSHKGRKFVEKIEDIRKGDCLIWVNTRGKPKGGVGHIAMANGPATRTQEGNGWKLYVVESRGGDGLTEGWYTSWLKKPRYFLTKPHGRSKRSRVKIVRPFP